jgi:hypothetical protein
LQEVAEQELSFLNFTFHKQFNYKTPFFWEYDAASYGMREESSANPLGQPDNSQLQYT